MKVWVPVGSKVVPLLFRILQGKPQKGTTMEPMGKVVGVGSSV